MKRILILVLLMPNLGMAESSVTTNKKLVRDFYEEVFVHHQAKEGAEKYLGEGYIQHNPNVATGRKPFVDFFVPFFKKHPSATSEIKRIVAEGDLVVLHVQSKQNQDDRGRAIVDIFRVENGKIAEHWDVGQAIPDKSANSNTMF